MKYLPMLVFLLLISSCSRQECYECKDGNATFEASDQFMEEYDFQIPNWAVAGQEIIPLFDLYRFDNGLFSITNPTLTLTGEDSEVFFEGDASSLIKGRVVEIPVSLLFSEDQLVEGQIQFDLSFNESVNNMPFSIEGSFLLISCETFSNPEIEIEGRADCRDNRIVTGLSHYDYGC